jgi:hypothetical protein
MERNSKMRSFSRNDSVITYNDIQEACDKLKDHELVPINNAVVTNSNIEHFVGYQKVRHLFNEDGLVEGGTRRAFATYLWKRFWS